MRGTKGATAIADYIYEQAERMVRRFGTRDPFEIARHLDVDITFRNDFKKLKGMYVVVKNQRFIYLNAVLPPRLHRVVCAHELGHDANHRKLAANAALREYMLYDMTSKPEYEANLYAAHLLLDEGDLLEYAEDGLNVQQIAEAMDTDINLLLIKMNAMNCKGYNFDLPYLPPSNFLGKE